MVSVIMGVYNAADTVEKAVRSVLANNCAMEIIIVDDASTDDSFGTVKRIGDKRITLVKNEKNMGLGYCLFNAAKMARGEFIARMDADDFSYPERLDRQLEYLKNNPEIQFCGTSAYLIWEGKKWGKRVYPTRPERKDILKRNPFIHPTLMFRKEALFEVGSYSAEKKYLRCEDYELIFRFYEKSMYGANLPEFLLDFSEPPYDTAKHTFNSRVNECRVRREGAKRLKAGFKGFLKSFYPIAIYFLPRYIYKRIHTAMWKID